MAKFISFVQLTLTYLKKPIMQVSVLVTFQFCVSRSSHFRSQWYYLHSLHFLWLFWVPLNKSWETVKPSNLKQTITKLTKHESKEVNHIFSLSIVYFHILLVFEAICAVTSICTIVECVLKFTKNYVKIGKSSTFIHDHIT